MLLLSGKEGRLIFVLSKQSKSSNLPPEPSIVLVLRCETTLDQYLHDLMEQRIRDRTLSKTFEAVSDHPSPTGDDRPSFWWDEQKAR